MKSKSLFFIFLMVCLVFFLTGCDSGGGGSSGGGGGDDNGGFEIGHSFDAGSVAVDETENTSLTFHAEITTNKGGTYNIKQAGTTVSEGKWEVTEWADKSKGRPKTIKYQEEKAWNGASLADVNAESHTTDVSEGSLAIISVSGHTAVFALSND